MTHRHAPRSSSRTTAICRDLLASAEIIQIVNSRVSASHRSPNWIAVGSLLHWLKKTNCSRFQTNVTSEGAGDARQFQSAGR